MPPKKVPFTPFRTRSRVRSPEPSGNLVEENASNGAFVESSVTFQPALPKAEVALTVSFRCTARIVRGDTITVRLGGFKGPVASLFCLEPRPHPENKDFRHAFHAYWSGEAPPKGGPPPQALILQARVSIETNTFVVIGVPDTVHIVLPDKLGANSAKLKIEGVVKHSNGPGPNGKIPKGAIETCPEVKKKTIDDDLAELEGQVRAIVEDQAIVTLGEDEVQFALETTQQDADHVWECARSVSELKVGLQFRMDHSVWTGYQDFAPLPELIMDCYRDATKRFHPIALHRELAANFEVSVGTIVMLEDVLYMLHGAQYAELSRAAILVLRLWTMEPVDCARVLRTTKAPSMQREIISGMRSLNRDVVRKWALTIGMLSTTPAKVSHVPADVLPSLYRAARDLPHEAVQRLQSLKKGDVYVFPGFSSYVPEFNRLQDEGYSPPDNAVVFEIRGLVDGIEIADLSQYPANGEWFLPLFASYHVESVETMAERNGLVYVVLRYHRNIMAQVAKDENFNDQHRAYMHAMASNAKSSVKMLGPHSHTIARLVYANIRLNDMKAMHPAHVVQRQYLEKYADTARLSQAKQDVEEGRVRWIMSNDVYVPVPGEPFNPRSITWDAVGKKQGAIIEAFFLKRTRSMKQFTSADGITVDFKEWTADIGKGVRRLQRTIDKMYTQPYAS